MDNRDTVDHDDVSELRLEFEKEQSLWVVVFVKFIWLLILVFYWFEIFSFISRYVGWLILDNFFFKEIVNYLDYQKIIFEFDMLKSVKIIRAIHSLPFRLSWKNLFPNCLTSVINKQINLIIIS